MSPTDEHSAPVTKKVGVIVLNYNGTRVLPGLLDSLERLDYPDFRVFLVDNASTDGSLALVRSYLDRLPMEIVENRENLLFSAGNNVGIERALEWGADYVFLLNNDTLVPPSILTELADFMGSNTQAGIAGPMIHFGEPVGAIWGAGGQVSLWWGLVRHRGIRQKDVGQYSQPAKVDYVSGAAMMISRAVIERIGMLDTDFPMYYEDTDFCFRARKAGFETWYVPAGPVIHLVSVAAGGQTSGFKIRRRFSSGMRFFARHARWYHWPTILLGQVSEAVRVTGLMLGRSSMNAR
jgi:GT2 family glycosyltransferase